MPFLPIASAVIGALGIISGFLGSKKAAKAAKEQSEEEAKAERELTAERVYQLGREERQLQGETVAGYAGGGVLSAFGSMGNVPRGTMGSARSVLSEQATTFQREVDITQRVGATKVQQGLAHGKALADRYKFEGYSNAATGIANILASFG